jgi:hypothetical protein
MAIERENFRPVTDVLPVVRRDIGLYDKTLADPDNVDHLVDGEWMTVNASNKLVRAVDIAAAGNEPATIGGYDPKLYPTWAERGRYDVQANYEKKLPILYMNAWEFETLIFDATATVTTGGPINGIHQPVKVASITIGTKTVSGLVGALKAEVGTKIIVGYVTRLHTDNGGWLRIRRDVV